MATNKDKIMIVLQSSKTHDEGCRPQIIYIESNRNEKSGAYLHRNFCPFTLINDFVVARHQQLYSMDEPLFIFRDGSPVLPYHARLVLKAMIARLGLNSNLYNIHSMRIGRSSDLFRYRYTIEEIKFKGRWKSNTVYKYIRN